MELLDLIYKLYEDFGEEIFLMKSDKLKIISEKHIDDLSGSFTVTLEIIIIDRICDDDYGIVFSTNAQKQSHYEIKSQIFNEGLYLISDLSFGDGEIINQSQEINYLPFEENSNIETWKMIENFTLSKTELIKEILRDKYRVND